MSYRILDANDHLVMISKSLGGAKRSAQARSKKEKDAPFKVKNPRGGVEAVYCNGNEQWVDSYVKPVRQ